MDIRVFGKDGREEQSPYVSIFMLSDEDGLTNFVFII